MLEARHLRKTYKTKRGTETKALDDVSVTFAEKGMVFILGKSGTCAADSTPWTAAKFS